jgi:phage terminase small subunit
MPKQLTAKQKLFCSQYALDCNATQAAIRAGYSPKSAARIASVLLKKEPVFAMVQAHQQALAEKLEIQAERVVQELARLAFSNLGEFLKPGMELKDLAELDLQKLKTIHSIKLTETEWEGGRKTSASIVLHDKMGALKELGRHLGIYERDNLQKMLTRPTVIYPGGDED